jgi:hypothetical protein
MVDRSCPLIRTCLLVRMCRFISYIIIIYLMLYICIYVHYSGIFYFILVVDYLEPGEYHGKPQGVSNTC